MPTKSELENELRKQAEEIGKLKAKLTQANERAKRAENRARELEPLLEVEEAPPPGTEETSTVTKTTEGTSVEHRVRPERVARARSFMDDLTAGLNPFSRR